MGKDRKEERGGRQGKAEQRVVLMAVATMEEDAAAAIIVDAIWIFYVWFSCFLSSVSSVSLAFVLLYFSIRFSSIFLRLIVYLSRDDIFRAASKLADDTWIWCAFYRLIPYLKIHVYGARSLTRGWFYCVRAAGTPSIISISEKLKQ